MANTSATNIAAPSRSTPLAAPGAREIACPSTMYRAKKAAFNRRRERQEVAAGAHACERDRDGRHELDGGHRGERQATDGEVEAGVHHRERHAEADHENAGASLTFGQDAPGPLPECEDEGG